MTLMHQASRRAIALALLGAFGAALPASAVTVELDKLVVTVSKLPEPAQTAPAMITEVDGAEFAARGATDLRSALALTGGVEISPGGDAGPANAVPAMWGLREFDAFLLVVDGVPWGGAFNPEVSTLDLHNVDRIEVLRGAAPVIYGATSFVGVIQVIQHPAGDTPARFSVTAGSHRNAGFAISGNLPPDGAFRQSYVVNAETQQFSQDRAQVDRMHVLYRGATDTDAGKLTTDVDLTVVRQDPYSPHPREGDALSSRFPLDANANPKDARQDLNRYQVNFGLTQNTGLGEWISTLSLARTDGHNTRGFLRADFATDGVTVNADGFRQNVTTTQLYFDSYLALHPRSDTAWFVGVDWLHGRGRQNSDNFEYAVRPDGSNAPASTDLHIDESTQLTDQRDFAGLYAQIEWRPAPLWNLSAGVRANRTAESRDGLVIDRNAGNGMDESADTRNNTRMTGAIGASYAIWSRAADQVNLFADYRNTYKPAAVDFGPEAEGEILKPETADSWEAGAKGRVGALSWSLSFFEMRFENLVIRENVGGLPALANAGKERFKGAEVEAEFQVTPELRIAASAAWHEAKFTDYARLRPDGSIQQLAGKYLELAPRQLSALGLFYAPAAAGQSGGGNGWLASAAWNYAGSRFLNKGNTSVAAGYSTLDAGLGYRFGAWTVRFDGVNLTDRRDPVAESELGDAQFYRLPGRVVKATVSYSF